LECRRKRNGKTGDVRIILKWILVKHVIKFFKPDFKSRLLRAQWQSLAPQIYCSRAYSTALFMHVHKSNTDYLPYHVCLSIHSTTDSFILSFQWHVQNVTIPCHSQELLTFLSVIYFKVLEHIMPRDYVCVESSTITCV
jgi:hypothetical protein